MKISPITIWKLSKKDTPGPYNILFRRYLAFWIDMAICLIPTMILTVIALSVGGEEYLTIAMMPFLVGLLFKDITGNSIGKRVMRLKLVSTNGKNLTWKRLILRNIFYLFFMFDVILLAINANSGRIGDYMAKTKVVLASSNTLMNL